MIRSVSKRGIGIFLIVLIVPNPRSQVDLRDETGVVEKLAKNRQKPITNEHGEKMAKELKAGNSSQPDDYD